VAPGADPAFQQAMDKLMLQVNGENVLAVHRAFQQHADELGSGLQQIGADVEIGLCGRDPVSEMAAGPQSFGGKVNQLLDAHWRHRDELAAVASLLRATARSYGHSEDEIERSLEDRAKS